MGDHRVNGNALAKMARPSFPAGMEMYGFRVNTVIELNAETMAEIKAIADAAEARGDDPRKALHHASQQWDPKNHPERFDYVAVNEATVGRPSPLLPDPNKVPTATIRLKELERVPLAELRKRADEAFAGAEAANRGAPQ